MMRCYPTCINLTRIFKIHFYSYHKANDKHIKRHKKGTYIPVNVNSKICGQGCSSNTYKLKFQKN